MSNSVNKALVVFGVGCIGVIGKLSRQLKETRTALHNAERMNEVYDINEKANDETIARLLTENGILKRKLESQ